MHVVNHRRHLFTYSQSSLIHYFLRTSIHSIGSASIISAGPAPFQLLQLPENTQNLCNGRYIHVLSWTVWWRNAKLAWKGHVRTTWWRFRVWMSLMQSLTASLHLNTMHLSGNSDTCLWHHSEEITTALPFMKVKLRSTARQTSMLAGICQAYQMYILCSRSKMIQIDHNRTKCSNPPVQHRLIVFDNMTTLVAIHTAMLRSFVNV